MNIVTKRVLAWKRYKFSCHAGSTDKEFAIMMKTFEGIFELVKICGCDRITAHDIAKFKKC